MTVLYFSDTRFPIERANGLQTMATCQALAERGHAVTLVVRPDSAAHARDPFAFYDLPHVPHLEIKTIPATGGGRRRRVRFLLSALAMASAKRDAVVYTRDLGLAAFLLQLPVPRRPRLVYESHGVAAIVSEELPRLLGKPDTAPSATKLARLDRRDRRVWTRANAYVTITRALANDLGARYGVRPHVFVAPDGARDPGVSAETNAASASVPGSPGAPIAAYAGHLYPWKGVDIFVRAIALVPGLRGLIVGGHPGEADRDRVAALVSALGIADRVEITGLIPPADVATHLARAAILVLPNTASAISERYTSPLKLFEYLWIGRPIVASNLTAVREVLTDERNALLVAPGDAQALARSFERLLANDGLAESLGRAARELAPEFTWAKRAARIESALVAARA